MSWHDTPEDAERRRAIEKLCGPERIRRISWFDVVLMLLLIAGLVATVAKFFPAVSLFFGWIGGWHAPF